MPGPPHRSGRYRYWWLGLCSTPGRVRGRRRSLVRTGLWARAGTRVRPRRSRATRWPPWWFRCGDQDALDGSVGRVAHRDCLGARGFQAGWGVSGPQPQDALGGAEPEQGIDLQQGGDDLTTRRADLFGGVPAPGRGTHVERDPLRRVVLNVGGPATFASHMGGHNLAVVDDLDHVRGRAGVDLLADQPPGHRVQGGADLDVDVGADLRCSPPWR